MKLTFTDKKSADKTIAFLNFNLFNKLITMPFVFLKRK